MKQAGYRKTNAAQSHLYVESKKIELIVTVEWCYWGYGNRGDVTKGANIHLLDE